MTTSLWISATLAGVLALATTAVAGGKPEGARCHVSRSCESQLCVRVSPGDKFGVCCQPDDCAALGAQCGSLDNNCGVEIYCGECNFGEVCSLNECVPEATTTTFPTTTTSTIPPTTTTTMPPTTTTTMPPTTTTTITPTTTLIAPTTTLL
jgi:hypothetical protein